MAKYDNRVRLTFFWFNNLSKHKKTFWMTKEQHMQNNFFVLGVFTIRVFDDDQNHGGLNGRKHFYNENAYVSAEFATVISDIRFLCTEFAFALIVVNTVFLLWLWSYRAFQNRQAFERAFRKGSESGMATWRFKVDPMRDCRRRVYENIRFHISTFIQYPSGGGLRTLTNLTRCLSFLIFSYKYFVVCRIFLYL